MLEFEQIDGLPPGFLEVEAREIQRVFPRPTLISLPGEKQAPLFVSILLHGNEDAGLLAFQNFMRRFDGRILPRNIQLFVGNVAACEAGVRFKKDQVDFNRSWPGTDLPPSPTGQMLQRIQEKVCQEKLFASIDIHNNTGRNPLYACVCSLAPHHLELASLFSSKIIYFLRPRGVQTQAFLSHCPATTLECGKIGDLAGAHAAADFLQKCCELDELPKQQVSQSQIFHTVARIKVREGCTIGFEGQNDVVLREDLDLLNFVELQPGEQLAKLNNRLEDCFLVNDQHGDDVTHEYLGAERDNVILQRPVTPSMLTQNLDVMRQDCVGYLMEELRHD